MAAAVRAMHGRVEGLVVLAPQLDTTALRELPATVPAVFMNSRVPGRTPSLAIDSYGGARAMVRHLIACGHRAIAHVTGPIDNFDSHERERGYLDELAASLPSALPHIVRGDFTETSGYEAGRALAAAAARPEAVFASNDAMAIGCLAALAALGVARAEFAAAARDRAQARRPLLVPVTLDEPACVAAPGDGDMPPRAARIAFRLPAGTYATVLARALGVAVAVDGRPPATTAAEAAVDGPPDP